MRRRDLLKAAPFLAPPGLAPLGLAPLGLAPLGLAPLGLATPGLAQGVKPLRFVPQANLSTLDPVWTTASVVINHAMMIYDTLYGLDAAGECQPQMCEGHEVSSDELTWTFTLRDNLLFHDGEKILARDCVVSIFRWSARDPFGQRLMRVTHEMKALDDKRFTIRLKKPFRHMLYALGARYCFIMPERIARLPAAEQLKDTTGSGPFRFKADEWVSGARAVYTRFDGYTPRQEAPDYFAGGKRVRFGRVEWIVQPDASTAAAALRTGEVDWVELPLIDLVPMLRATPNVVVKVNDPYGWLPVIAFNHLHPPFDNVTLRRAVLTAIDQGAFVDAIIGGEAEFGRLPAGYFTEGHPMATHAGLEVMEGEKGLTRAKQLVTESGYAGETVVLIAPSDYPTILQLAQVTRALFQTLGLKVDYQVMDWGSLVTRRANQGPPDKGGWNVFNTLWGGLTVSNPGSAFPLRGNGRKGPVGWPTDERLETLREEWFDAPDLASRKALAERIQIQALQTVPYVPLGQVYQPTAFRSDLKDIVPAHLPLFWNARRE